MRRYLSGVRVFERKPEFRRDLQIPRHQIHRSERRRHDADERQEQSQAGDERGGRARHTRQRRRHQGCRGGEETGQRDGLSGHPQSRGGRWRTRHARRRGRELHRKRLSRRRERSDHGLRRRHDLHGEVHRKPAPYRGAGAGRLPRQRRAYRRAGLLDAAPPPEADRRVSGDVPRRRDPRQASRSGGQGDEAHRVRECGNIRVSRGQAQKLLLHGDEHPPAGGALRQRDGQRHRHHRMDDPHRRGGHPFRSERRAARGPRHRVPHHGRGPGELHAVPGQDQQMDRPRRQGCAYRQPRPCGLHHPPALRLDDRQGDRLGRRPRPRHQKDAARHGRVRSRRHQDRH